VSSSPVLQAVSVLPLFRLIDAGHQVLASVRLRGGRQVAYPVELRCIEGELRLFTNLESLAAEPPMSAVRVIHCACQNDSRSTRLM